jgi:hypothetical protein
MKYVENEYYPAWVPKDMRAIVDRSELAKPNEKIIEEADFLLRILEKNIAIYKQSTPEPLSIKNGLCSIFKAAALHPNQLKIILMAEMRLKEYAIVAYENPLQYLY